MNAQKINEREVIIRKYVQISENVEVVRGYSGLSFCDLFALYLVQSEMEVLLDSGRQDLFKKALKLRSLSPKMSLHTNDPLMGTLTR